MWPSFQSHVCCNVFYCQFRSSRILASGHLHLQVFVDYTKSAEREVGLSEFSSSFWCCCQFYPKCRQWCGKGRRARHLPRLPFSLGPPSRCFARLFSSILVENLLSIHVIYSEADCKQGFCFQRAPNSNCYVRVLCFLKALNCNI